VGRKWLILQYNCAFYLINKFQVYVIHDELEYKDELIYFIRRTLDRANLNLFSFLEVKKLKSRQKIKQKEHLSIRHRTYHQVLIIIGILNNTFSSQHTPLDKVSSNLENVHHDEVDKTKVKLVM
jgi:hypothetical protein